jgi:hypothetical protein
MIEVLISKQEQQMPKQAQPEGSVLQGGRGIK